MAKANLSIQVKVSWWFVKLYIPTHAACHWMYVHFINHYADVNVERVKWWAGKAAKFYINGKLLHPPIVFITKRGITNGTK